MRSLLFVIILTAVARAADSDTVVLNATGVKNLHIETVEVEESDFEETVFSLGTIAAVPARVGAVSTRIPGRIVELKVSPGDSVKEGDEVARLQSRQPGDPPPVISLTAPLSGLVTHVDARLGDPLEPEKALMEITDLSEVYAIARVPEHQAGRMKPGTAAHIKAVAFPDDIFEGEMLRFGTSADAESGTIDAVFRLPNPNGTLRAGMRAEFSIVMSKRENVVSVPRSAIQGEASNRFVYVRHFDLPNAFVKTQVATGEINDRYAEITSGLFPADEVVTRGAYSLSFAGGGSVSLKEALDAAHGHEHAADGSELKPGEKAGGAATAHEGEDEGHESNPMWMAASGILFVLLVVSLFMKRGSRHGEPEEREAA